MAVRSEASYWVGHSYCNGTSNQWSCCLNQYGNPSNQESYPFNNNQPCWCPEENAMIAFTAPSVIPSVAYLDLARPGTISYYPGHAPSMVQGESSTTISAAATSSGADPSAGSAKSTSQSTRFLSSLSTQRNSPASNAASSTAVPPPGSATSLPSSDPGLSTGAKIGIGVGIGAGALVLAGLIGLVIRHLHKRRKTTPPPIEDQIRPRSFGSFAGLTEAKSPEGANGDLLSTAWSGHKSELPADENAVVSPTIAPSTASTAMAEVEGTDARQSVQSQPSVDGNGIRQYVPYSVMRGRSVQSMQSIHEMPG